MRRTNTVKMGSAPAWTESWGSRFDDASGNEAGRPTFENSGVSTPAVNIIETKEELHVQMVAPGMKKEAFKVSLQALVLTISYDNEDNREAERKGWKYRMREYNYHSFMRSFKLPETVEPDRIDANYTDGILHLRIPKKKEAITRDIEVL